MFEAARVEAMLAELDIRPGITLEEVHSLAERKLGRRVSTQYVAGLGRTPGSPCGVWWSNPSGLEDTFLIPQEAKQAHRTIIHLHEIAHVVLEHAPRPIRQRDIANLVIPVRALRGAGILYRANVSSANELEAEALAEQLWRMISAMPHRTSAATGFGRFLQWKL